MSHKQPFGVVNVTTLVPFIFESNPWDLGFWEDGKIRSAKKLLTQQLLFFNLKRKQLFSTRED